VKIIEGKKETVEEFKKLKMLVEELEKDFREGKITREEYLERLGFPLVKELK